MYKRQILRLSYPYIPMGSLELKYRSVMKEAAYLAAFIIYGDLVIEPEQIFVIKLKPDGISCTIHIMSV